WRAGAAILCGASGAARSAGLGNLGSDAQGALPRQRGCGRLVSATKRLGSGPIRHQGVQPLEPELLLRPNVATRRSMRWDGWHRYARTVRAAGRVTGPKAI